MNNFKAPVRTQNMLMKAYIGGDISGQWSPLSRDIETQVSYQTKLKVWMNEWEWILKPVK